MTIGRVTRKSGGAGRKAGLQWAQSIGRIGATVTVDRFALYTWAPRSASRHFTIVEARPLGLA